MPGILKSQKEDGAFGSGLFIVADQNVIFPLAVAYSLEGADNPYYKDPKVLEAIMDGGDRLIAAQDEKGMFRFDKKDGSYWNQIYMPWTYSRWARAFSLVKEAMPQDRREKWEKALTLGFDGVSKTALRSVHNIPTHHAMGLAIAGQALGRPEWTQQAGDFMQQVIAKQTEGGYWSEHSGPVVSYDFVYVDSIGTYLAATGDERVRPALEKAAKFHLFATYPDGSNLETVDERNPYHKGATAGNVGFTFSPEGRAWLAMQWDQLEWKLAADNVASLLMYGEEGPAADVAKSAVNVLEENGPRAVTLRQGPWFVALSGYATEQPDSRWIQDRQNLMSIWHEDAGLLVGGGNTKLQPAWSTFTVGDMAGLKHTAGDENPDFKPKLGLIHIPAEAKLTGIEGENPTPGLELTYGPVMAKVRTAVDAQNRVTVTYSAESSTDQPVLAHMTLIPEMGATLKTAGGFEGKLGEERIDVDAAQVGGKLTYRGTDFTLPEGASIHWPTLPHNPYRKDGRADASEGLIEIRIPIAAGAEQSVVLSRVQAN